MATPFYTTPQTAASSPSPKFGGGATLPKENYDYSYTAPEAYVLTHEKNMATRMLYE
jgi:hypothetical protein